MFFFWTVSLMLALQHVSSDEEVSLSCNQTVEVTSGGAVTIECLVTWKRPIAECGNISFTWMGKNQSNLCWSNICNKERPTLITLQMGNVSEEENVTVGVSASCGMDESMIRVKIVEDDGKISGSRRKEPSNLTVQVVLAVAAICIGATVLLYIRKRHIKNQKQENVEQGEQLPTEEQNIHEEDSRKYLLQNPEKESSRGQKQWTEMLDKSPPAGGGPTV